MKQSTMTRDEIEERIEELDDEIGALEFERDELLDAIKRGLTDPDDDAAVLVGKLCIACDLNAPGHRSVFCPDCERKGRALLAQGIRPERISMGRAPLTAALEKLGVA